MSDYQIVTDPQHRINYEAAIQLVRQPFAQCGLKSLDSQIIALSQAASRMIGFKSRSDAEGLYDHELPCKAAEMHEDFRHCDLLALSGCPKETMGRFTYAAESVYLMGKHFQLIKDNTVCGVFIMHHAIKEGMLIKLINGLMQTDAKYHGGGDDASYQLGNMFIDGNKLTPRQEECLFFLLRGYTAKSISEHLCISKRTVETYVEQLKNKFACRNKQQLIEKAFQLQLFSYIPKSLNFSFDLLVVF